MTKGQEAYLMTHDDLTTVEALYKDAKDKLKEAYDQEWEYPADPALRRRVKFWESELDRLSHMGPTEIVPCF